MTLAVICGLFIAGILGFFLMIGFIGSIAAVGSSTTTAAIPSEGVLKIDMSSFSLAEMAVEDDPFAMLNAEMLNAENVEQISLRKAVLAVNAAASDPAVKYIYLKTDNVASDIYAIEEFRKALARFRESGKAIVAYTETPTTGGYWMASVADKVYLSSYAGTSAMMTGISSRLIFLKDLLDKFGVNIQLIRHGKYKSAGEMYIKNAASAENLEQTREMVESLWNSIVEDITSSRDITAEKLSWLIDNLGLETPEDFIANSLADEMFTRGELQAKLAVLAGKDSYKDVKFINFADYVTAKVTDNNKAKNKIAIIYADGEIVEGNEAKDVAGNRFARVIAKIREDKDVKAVVLRVTSPGGSVTASDKIKTEIDLLRAEKPVIASYGSYAASGGYWISNSCDKIFSDKTTLTGSIGVFGMIPDISKTLKDVAKVNVTFVGSSSHGDRYSMTRPLDAAEVAATQKSIDNIYEHFVNIVAEGRNLDPSFVDSIAQGRVWTGTDGLKLGLVDEIGTLEDAIRYAADMAGDSDLASWKIAEYPKAQTTLEMILSKLDKTSDAEEALAGTGLEGIARAFADFGKKKSERVYARMPYQYIIE